MRRLTVAVALLSLPGIAMAQHLIEGVSDSPVRVIIYEDLQCPDCAAFRTMLDNQLLPRYAGKVHFEHRDFPLAKHAWARKAAIAARFFEESRPEKAVACRKYFLGHLNEITAENFSDRLAEFAKQAGADPAAALAALNDPRLAALVEKDYQEGLARGIAHTPTVLVNGAPFIESFSFEAIAQSIDRELAAK